MPSIITILVAALFTVLGFALWFTSAPLLNFVAYEKVKDRRSLHRFAAKHLWCAAVVLLVCALLVFQRPGTPAPMSAVVVMGVVLAMVMRLAATVDRFYR